VRLRIRLLDWGLNGHLSWADCADVLADYEADLEVAVEQALEDRELLSVDQAQARHGAVVFAMLGGRDRLAS
jgi:hypothetical protein